jgi:GNAT superfamily N-acetyltransferase
MTRLKNRPYRSHAEDAADVLTFLSTISQHPDFVADAFPGDFVWRNFRIPEGSVGDEISLWVQPGGQIAGMGSFLPPNELEITVDPALYGSPDEAEVIRRIIAWAQERYEASRNENAESLGLTLRADDLSTQGTITGLGFRFSGETRYASNFRTLDEPIPAPILPGGYEIVAMTDDADLTDRVELHREVWAPSKFTHEGYRMLRTAPVYRQDLDLAVRAPDGRYASYLIGWWDPIAKTGLLEPVGARAEYRRLGLTKALFQETLRRFQALGAIRAYVNSRAVDPPANALYRSAGFRRIAEWQWWTRGS